MRHTNASPPFSGPDDESVPIWNIRDGSLKKINDDARWFFFYCIQSFTLRPVALCRVCQNLRRMAIYSIAFFPSNKSMEYNRFTRSSEVYVYVPASELLFGSWVDISRTENLLNMMIDEDGDVHRCDEGQAGFIIFSKMLRDPDIGIKIRTRL